MCVIAFLLRVRWEYYTCKVSASSLLAQLSPKTRNMVKWFDWLRPNVTQSDCSSQINMLDPVVGLISTKPDMFKSCGFTRGYVLDCLLCVSNNFLKKSAGLTRFISPALQGFISLLRQSYLLEGVALTDDPHATSFQGKSHPHLHDVWCMYFNQQRKHQSAQHGLSRRGLK